MRGGERVLMMQAHIALHKQWCDIGIVSVQHEG